MYHIKIERWKNISKITYHDNSYYYGDEVDGIRNGYGKLCNENTTIIEAGIWRNDKCVKKMTEIEIEAVLKDKY